MNKFILLLILILFTGCYGLDMKFQILRDHWNGTYENEYKTLRILATGNRVFDGDPEPKFPEDPNDTIEGVDSDNDGIRDDVEIWINTHYETYNERMAWKSYARARQKFMLYGGEEVTNKLDWAHMCIYLIYLLPVQIDYDSRYLHPLQKLDQIILSTFKRYD